MKSLRRFEVEHPTKIARLRGLNRRRARQLITAAKGEPSAAGRIDFLSQQFLGCPYQADPLIGSAEIAEVFTASLEWFDCVTYLETIVALAGASDVDDFADLLRRIRYDQGRIEWDRRNHYMTRWIRNNLREGILTGLSTRAVPTVSRVRILDVVRGLPARKTQMKWVPKRAFTRLEPHLETGDLIFFVSTRKNLDVFHAAIIVRVGQKLSMRHASRSQAGVVEQELREFLDANRMSGVIVARPRG
jgi:N-acetylmuramoyl-L-alanine amidase-like protein